MTRTRHLENTDEVRNSRALVTERIVVGLCRHESDLRRLLSVLRHSGFDIDKVSVVMLSAHGRTEESRALRTSLILDGATRVDSNEGILLVAGPIKRFLTVDGNNDFLLQAVIRLLEQTLSAWGVEAAQLSRLEAGITAGRCLVVLHATLREVPAALEAMRRASAEHVAMIGRYVSLPKVIEEEGGSSNDEDET